MKILLSFALPLALLLACGDKDDDSGATGTVDAATACTDLCTGSGFSSGTVAEYDHEANCSCDGSGAVTDADCTDMCADIGWGAGETYSSTGGDINSCSCYSP